MFKRDKSSCFMLILVILSFISKNSFAQQVSDAIRGQVLDHFGQGLADVHIRIKGSEEIIATDKEGKFTIQGEKPTVILIESEHYYPREIANPLHNAVYRLEERFLKTSNELDVLYGVADQQSFLGAASTVYSNELGTTPATLYAYALPGRLTGLYAKQVSGFKGAATDANFTSAILGNIAKSGATPPSDNSEIEFTLRGNKPVVVIDGVQRDIYSIDAENIESVTVLKDALSTVLLGQRSSSGILLITTKKPVTGKPRISFTAQTALQQPLGIPKPLSAYQYAYLYNEALQNGGGTMLFKQDDFLKFKNGSSPYTHPDVNWYDVIYRNYSPLSRYNLNVNGGNKNAQYSISLNYTDQQGLFVEDDAIDHNTNASLSRYVLNSSVNVNVTEKLKVGLQIFGRLQSGNQPGAGISDILSQLNSMPNYAMPVFNENGSYAANSNFRRNLLSKVVNSGYIQDNLRDVMANLDFSYDLGSVLEGLSFLGKTNIAIQSATTINRSRADVGYQMRINGNDTTYIRIDEPQSQTNNFTPVFNSRYWFGQAGFSYNRAFGLHNVGATLIGDQRRMIFNFDLPGVSSNVSTKANYGYSNKYFAEGIINYSGYNRYMPGQRFGLFYAVGIGWDISQESFIKDHIDWLSQFKLRSTYGRTGNGVDNSGYYDYRSTYEELFNVYPQGTSTEGTSPGFIESAILPNVNRTWEKANKFNVGVDLSAFKNTLQFSVDYYNDLYYDLLAMRGKSIQLIGATYGYENIGKRRQSGWEFSGTYQNNISSFNYFISGDLSLEDAKLLYFDEQDQLYPWMQRTGLHPDTPFGYIAEGFFQTAEEASNSATISGYQPIAGDIKYKDLNEDGIINVFDSAPLMKVKPRMYYGITLGVNYKGIEFSSLLQGVRNTFTTSDRESFSSGFFPGQSYEYILNRWTPETASTATFPRLTTAFSVNNTAASSFWLRSSDYFRLKNVSLAYNLPYSIVKNMRLSGLKVFTNIQNLFTWMEDRRYDYDPEVGMNAYPIQRVFNLGVNIKL